MDIRQIIKASRKGDEHAQRMLYEKHKRMLFMICLRYARNRAEAEDILQEGFIRIFRDLKQFKGDGDLAAWMRRVMINSALQYLRKWKKHLPTLDEDYVANIPAIEHSVYDKIGAEELTRLIQHLPTGYRIVFNLFVIEGYAHKEIAYLLGIKETTSKSQLFKAKIALREMLEKQLLT